MADQDSPWKGLPPAPPGVPDQAPKPSGGAAPAPPKGDPWARPAGWTPPSRRGGSGSKASGGPSSRGPKILLAIGAFLVLNVCIRSGGALFPDPDDGGAQPPAPAFGSGVPDAPDPFRTLRLARAGRATPAPQGWFRYAPADGAFSVAGPGRPEQDVSERAGRYVFRGEGVDLTADVRRVRASNAQQVRAVLERETAIFLDDLGAIEQARRWSGSGADVVLEVDARRGDAKFRIRTLVAPRLLLRASAGWEGTLSAERAEAVEAFLRGLVVGVPA